MAPAVTQEMTEQTIKASRGASCADEQCLGKKRKVASRPRLARHLDKRSLLSWPGIGIVKVLFLLQRNPALFYRGIWAAERNCIRKVAVIAR